MENVIIEDVSQLKNNLTQLRSDIVNIIYPIGSIYISVNAVNPKELFGGEWTQIKDRFLLGAGSRSNGEQGGADYHQHGYRIGYRSFYQNLGGPVDSMIRAYDYTTKKWVDSAADEGVKTSVCKINTGTQGSSTDNSALTGRSVFAYTDSNNALPPYLVVSIWQRVS